MVCIGALAEQIGDKLEKMRAESRENVRYERGKLFSSNGNFVISIILNPNQLYIVNEVMLSQQWNQPVLGNLP